MFKTVSPKTSSRSFLDKKLRDVESFTKQTLSQSSQHLLQKTQSSPQVLKLYNKAKELHEKGELKKALVCYYECINQDGLYVPAYVGASVIHNDMGGYDKAKVFLQKAKAVALRPNIFKIKNQVVTKYIEIMDIYLKHKQYSVAFKYGLRVVKLAPKNYGVYARVAVALIALKEYQKAIDLLLRVRKEFPQNCRYELDLLLGKAYYKNKEVLQASTVWESLSQIFPNKRELILLVRFVRALKFVC